MAKVEFRTGKKEIPDYMAELMAGIPTHKLTYKQAVAAMNAKMLNDHVGRSMDRIVDDHFNRRR
jgi:hypothetical protein